MGQGLMGDRPDSVPVCWRVRIHDLSIKRHGGAQQPASLANSRRTEEYCWLQLLQPGEIEWNRAVDERLPLRFLLLFGEEKGCSDLVVDVLHGLHGLVAQHGLPWVRRVEIRELATYLFMAFDCATICPSTSSTGKAPNGVSPLRRSQSEIGTRSSSNAIPPIERASLAGSPRPP
jgi:hypothetical protein